MLLEWVLCLFLYSAARADIISRLQNISQEAEAGSDGHLDAVLKKALTNASTDWNREKTFYTSDGIRRVAGKLSVLVRTASCKSDLEQMTAKLLLLTEVTHKSSRERRQVSCGGTAALGDQDVEWLLLECRIKSPQNPQVYTQIGRRSSAGLQGILDGDLEKDLEDVLGSLVSQIFRKVLAKTQTHSLPYTAEDSNTLMDAAISLIVFVVERTYNDTIRIPDIREGVSLNMLILSLDTGFTANRGVVRQVSTLRREGNARITKKNVTLHYAGSLQFQRLNVEYAEYRAAVLGIGPSGRLNLTVEPVTVGLRLRIDFGLRRIFLDSFRIRSLGRTWVNITGLGGGKLLAELTACFLGLVRSHVLRFLEWRIATYTREAFAKYTLDQILTGEFLA